MLSLCLASLRAVNAATGQVLSTRRRRTTIPQVVTLVAAVELVNGRTRRRNVYDKKSQHYAKDNRTAFKSVAYA